MRHGTNTFGSRNDHAMDTSSGTTSPGAAVATEEWDQEKERFFYANNV